MSNELSPAVKAYYRAKPYLPRWLRLQMRRALAEGLRKKYASVWPIDEGSAQPPKGWSGWPEGKDFAFVLTHDVETSTGLENVKALAELEMEFGLRSAFNFIPEGPYSVSDELRHWLLDNGFEVGVHDLNHDGHLYDSREGFKEKAERINQYLDDWGAVGFRSGFMLRKLDWLHDLKISYDASTFDTDPFEPQPGGEQTIFPFLVSNENGSSYVELPYTLAQDSTLYLLLGETNADVWMNKLDWVADKGGMALVNIHPDYINFEDDCFSKKFYPHTVLRDFFGKVVRDYQEVSWSCLPKEVAAWFAKEGSEHAVGEAVSG